MSRGALEKTGFYLPTPPGPGLTFHCAGCGQRRQIVGRRKPVKGGAWICAICIAKNQEKD